MPEGRPVVVLHPRGAEGVASRLRPLADRLDLRCPHDEDGVARELKEGAEILVSFDWRADFLTPSLRWVQGRGIGYDRFPVADLARADVVLTTGGGIHHTAVAEHALALLLSLTRGIGSSVRDQDAHRWAVRADVELGGSTVAVLGLGDVGSAVVRRLQGWDLRILGVTRDPTRDRPDLDGRVETIRGLSDLLDVTHEADVLVVCVPRPTDGLPVVRHEHLRALGAGWLVDVSRGGVVDPTALLGALTDGELRGAGLDVFPVEPLPSTSPLWDLPHVVITPHKAGATPRYAARFAELFGANLAAHEGRRAWVNLVRDGHLAHRLTSDTVLA